MLAPQLVDEPLCVYRLAGVKDEQGQKSPAAPGRQGHALCPVQHLGWPQDAELHRISSSAGFDASTSPQPPGSVSVHLS